MPLNRPGIGKGALERVIAAGQRTAKGLPGSLQRIDPTAVVGRKACFPRDDVKRGALLRTGLGEQQAAVLEIKRREAALPRKRLARSAPVEAAGDHEMQDDPKIVVEAEDDPLTEPAERPNPLAVERVQWRRDGTQQKRALEPHVVEPLSAHMTLQRFDVGDNVRKLGHLLSVGNRSVRERGNLCQ